jgi:hypothetical protein
MAFQAFFSPLASVLFSGNFHTRIIPLVIGKSSVPTTDSFTNSLSVLIRSTFCKETISRFILPVPGSLCGFPAPGPTLARRHGLYIILSFIDLSIRKNQSN